MTNRVGRYYILIMKYLLEMLLVISDDITGIQSVEYSYRTTNQIQNDDTLYIYLKSASFCSFNIEMSNKNKIGYCSR